MSKLLKSFLQNVILPAALLVVSKVAGLYLAITLYQLDFFLDTRPGGIYSLQIYFTNNQDTLIANSFSNLVMFFSIALTTIYFLIKYRFSLLVTYDPKSMVKFNNLNLLPWINKKGNTFLRVFVWSLFLWVACITIITDEIARNNFSWISLSTFIVTIVSSWVLIRTFEIEGEIIYPHSKTSNLY